MTPLRQAPRLLRIGAVLVRYRLDDLVDSAHLFRPLKWLRPLLPRPRADIAKLSRGARLRLALVELGPIFVKFGQILSTRRDLLPADIAEELAQLQDQVPPFDGSQARAAVETALHGKIATLYKSFDETPLASASIAQVHAARLPDETEVVVKVLRPGIHARIRADIDLLRALGELAQRWHPAADKIHPREIVAEIETHAEPRTRPAARGRECEPVAAQFFRRFDRPASCHEVHLVALERIGAHAGARARHSASMISSALDAAGIDRDCACREKACACSIPRCSATTSFTPTRIPGNIWVDLSNAPENPRFIALDCGIMGSLSERDQFWLAENFMALFERNYRRIAELHIEAGWMPATLRLDELEADVRTICEPYFTRPLSEISLGEVVAKLFSVARRHELTIAAAIDPAAEDAAEHRGHGPAAASAHRHLGDSQAGAGGHPASPLWPAPHAARAACAPARVAGCSAPGDAATGAHVPEKGSSRRLRRAQCGAEDSARTCRKFAARRSAAARPRWPLFGRRAACAPCRCIFSMRAGRTFGAPPVSALIGLVAGTTAFVAAALCGVSAVNPLEVVYEDAATAGGKQTCGVARPSQQDRRR